MKNTFVASMLTVLFCLSSTGFSSDIDKLIKDLGKKDTAKDASAELAKIGKTAVPALIKALGENDKYTKRYAARALREMGEDASDSIPALSNTIKDSDSQTREYVVEALGNMVNEAEQVIPILKKAVKDSDNDVKKKAAKSLNSLKTHIEEVKNQKEIANQEELKKQEETKKQQELAEQEEHKKQDAKKQRELAEQERQKKQDEIRKQKELAEQGNASAQYSLGLMYYDGNGVPENENEAEKWFKKAADQGHKESQIILLEMKNTKETLKVKGFYIGMKIDKAVKLLNEKYKDIALGSDGLFTIFVGSDEISPTEEPIKNEGRYYYYDHVVSHKNMVGSELFSDQLFIKADESGKIILIHFPEEIVNNLFNVEDMDGKSFAQTFINNYSIQKLEVETREIHWPVESIYYVWTYTSDKGFKVAIDEHKNLTIEKVASAKERKFD